MLIQDGWSLQSLLTPPAQPRVLDFGGISA
jgi:hypothetical protein